MMPRSARVVFEGVVHHITQRGNYKEKQGLHFLKIGSSFRRIASRFLVLRPRSGTGIYDCVGNYVGLIVQYTCTGGGFMKYIATRDLRSNPSAVWETLDEGSEVIVTVNGKPKAIMIRADEDLEFLIKAIARAKAELAVERMRLQSLNNGLDSLSSEEIEREISESRKADR